MIGGRRVKFSQHFVLNKKLVQYIGNQTRCTTVVTSTNATNCYDRIAHLDAIMTNQNFGSQVEYLIILFATTQSIKISLRISYGFSEIFCIGSGDIPFQGVVQGNGASPPIWLILSMFLFRYSYDSNLVSVSKTLVSLYAYQIAAFLCVDYANLVALNNGKESEIFIVVRYQLLIDEWQKALNIRGRDLKL